MLVRFYWDEAGCFIASDDPEFQRLFECPDGWVGWLPTSEFEVVS